MFIQTLNKEPGWKAYSTLFSNVNRPKDSQMQSSSTNSNIHRGYKRLGLVEPVKLLFTTKVLTLSYAALPFDSVSHNLIYWLRFV